MFSVHISLLSKSPEMMNYVMSLSGLFYELLASDITPLEQLSQILEIYRNSDMLPFYKTDLFKSNIRHSLSVVLLQVYLERTYD